MEEDSEKQFYIEFILEGSAKVPESKVEEVQKKLASLINKAFKNDSSIRVMTQISKFSEEEIAMSLFQNIPESEYDN